MSLGGLQSKSKLGKGVVGHELICVLSGPRNKQVRSHATHGRRSDAATDRLLVGQRVGKTSHSDCEEEGQIRLGGRRLHHRKGRFYVSQGHSRFYRAAKGLGTDKVTSGTTGHNYECTHTANTLR